MPNLKIIHQGTVEICPWADECIAPGCIKIQTWTFGVVKSLKSRSGLSQNARLLISNVLHQWTWQDSRQRVLPLHFMVEPSASSLSCPHNHKESTFASIKMSVVWLKAIISAKTTQDLCLSSVMLFYSVAMATEQHTDTGNLCWIWSSLCCPVDTEFLLQQLHHLCQKYFPKSAMRKAKPSFSQRNLKWKQPCNKFTGSTSCCLWSLYLRAFELIRQSKTTRNAPKKKKILCSELYIFIAVFSDLWHLLLM